MAGPSSTHSNNAEIKFRKQVLFDYLRGNRFSPYMGRSQTSIIHLYYENKEGGDQVNIPLINVLSGAGKGSGTLIDNEEEMDSYGFRVWSDWARNAVVFKKNQIQKSSFDPLAQARPALTQWGQRTQRDEIIQALLAIPAEAAPANHGSDAGQRINGILYGSATTGQKNTWHQANVDRVLYGSTPGNFVTNDHAASLANVTGAQKFDADLLRLMKRRAMATTGSQPAITPWMLKEPNSEWFLVACGSRAFRDFAGSDEVKQANREARARERDDWKMNPIFRAGDIVLEGCIVTEIPEMDVLLSPFFVDAGSGSADLTPVFMLGQNAVSMPFVQNPMPTRRTETDYGFKQGVGIEMAYGVAKTAKAPIGGGDLKDWGVHTTFCAAASDGAGSS